jgi:hypothetical protein
MAESDSSKTTCRSNITEPLLKDPVACSIVPFLIAEHSSDKQESDNDTNPFAETVRLKLSTATTGGS